MELEKMDNWENNSIIEELHLLLQQIFGNKESKEKNQPLPYKISDGMFQELLEMEGSQNFVAQKHKNKFWEDFVTWPYGMTLKRIDKNGNLLDTPVAFKEWERVTSMWAKENARVFYEIKAKEVSWFLVDHWLNYNQNQLDSLVSMMSNVTSKSATTLKDFLVSNRNSWLNEIYNFIVNFALRSSNGIKQPGLEVRRLFEANWFNWVINSVNYYRNLLFPKNNSKNRSKIKSKGRYKSFKKS